LGCRLHTRDTIWQVGVRQSSSNIQIRNIWPQLWLSDGFSMEASPGATQSYHLVWANSTIPKEQITKQHKAKLAKVNLSPAWNTQQSHIYQANTCLTRCIGPAPSWKRPEKADKEVCSNFQVPLQRDFIELEVCYCS
jgi:hypothetical protein